MQINNSLAAVVTGGASGLGKASAEALAGAGIKVAIFDINEEAGEAFAKEIGGVYCPVNVTSSAEVDAGFAKGLLGKGSAAARVAAAAPGARATQFAQSLQKAGYATDPAYADKLTRVINTTLRLQRQVA